MKRVKITFIATPIGAKEPHWFEAEYEIEGDTVFLVPGTLKDLGPLPND